jgi:hypothetical protein
MKQTFEFQVKRNMISQNSFGIVDSCNDVVLNVSIGINSPTYGWFEFYDIESGGSEWYAEGSLNFENRELIGYDGVYCLSDFIVDKLEELGYNVADMRESLA